MISKILLPIPINKTFFYETTKFLKPGVVVEVEFKNKITFGMVLETFEEKQITKKLKKIKKVIYDTPLPIEIFKTIKFVANYTCNYEALVLKLFLIGINKNTHFHVTKKTYPVRKKLKLSHQQKNVISTLLSFKNKFQVALLHGVTGSGKTRVYMHAVKEKVSNGFQCLILVPEIILTSEWVKEIQRDFGLDPIVYHSSVNKKKKEEINKGVFLNKINLIIGTRSALSLPFIKLGLIVVDEEHDSSYKQESQLILNFRDFAIVRAKYVNCNVLLSSATPSIESFFNVKIKKYKILKLSSRVNQNRLPVIKTISLCKEKRIISEELKEKIKNNISKNFQTLLFLNKRGYAPYVVCSNCGVSKSCGKCSSALTLHEFESKNNSYLLCHHCNYREIFKNICGSCESKDSLIFPGYGIEKVYEEVNKLFPDVKIALLSSDKIKKKDFKEQIKNIIENKVNIIIGTQIISKGHNFPFLKTVGILNIDSLLNDFDFRANEKAFQQITQVAGRAGRKDIQGEVFIQSFQPEHPVIKFSILNDYDGFLDYELIRRRENNLPPYTTFIAIIITSKNQKRANDFIFHLFSNIREAFPDISIFGPAPSVIFKQNNLYRFRILIKVKKLYSLQKNLKSFLKKNSTPSGVNIHIDVDPINFL